MRKPSSPKAIHLIFFGVLLSLMGKDVKAANCPGFPGITDPQACAAALAAQDAQEAGAANTSSSGNPGGGTEQAPTRKPDEANALREQEEQRRRELREQEMRRAKEEARRVEIIQEQRGRIADEQTEEWIQETGVGHRQQFGGPAVNVMIPSESGNGMVNQESGGEAGTLVVQIPQVKEVVSVPDLVEQKKIDSLVKQFGEFDVGAGDLSKLSSSAAQFQADRGLMFFPVAYRLMDQIEQGNDARQLQLDREMQFLNSLLSGLNLSAGQPMQQAAANPNNISITNDGSVSPPTINNQPAFNSKNKLVLFDRKLASDPSGNAGDVNGAKGYGLVTPKQIVIKAEDVSSKEERDSRSDEIADRLNKERARRDWLNRSAENLEVLRKQVEKARALAGIKPEQNGGGRQSPEASAPTFPGKFLVVFGSGILALFALLFRKKLISFFSLARKKTSHWKKGEVEELTGATVQDIRRLQVREKKSKGRKASLGILPVLALIILTMCVGKVVFGASATTQKCQELRQTLERENKQGSLSAKFELGMYYLDSVCENDYQKVSTLTHELQQKGHEGGDLLLGYLSYHGWGRTQDDALAFQSFRKALVKNPRFPASDEADARFHLGILLREGRGVKEDKIGGLQLISKAALEGSKEAKDYISEKIDRDPWTLATISALYGAALALLGLGIAIRISLKSGTFAKESKTPITKLLPYFQMRILRKATRMQKEMVRHLSEKDMINIIRHADAELAQSLVGKLPEETQAKLLASISDKEFVMISNPLFLTKKDREALIQARRSASRASLKVVSG